MLEQVKEYLEKYQIKSKEQLEKHIEELSRNTYPDKDLVFMLVSVLDDKELLSKLFSRKKENKKVLYSTVESYSKQALKDIYGELANIVMNCKGAYKVKQKPMNRLVEEELEKQEQQVFIDWNSNGTGGVLQHWQTLHNDMQNVTQTVGIKESQEEEKAPIFTYCNQMKNAIEALSLRSLAGHKKYEKENDWENFSRVPNGDFEYSNAQFRHALGIGKEDERDHRIAEAWNAVVRLEIYLRNNLDIKK